MLTTAGATLRVASTMALQRWEYKVSLTSARSAPFPGSTRPPVESMASTPPPVAGTVARGVKKPVFTPQQHRPQDGAQQQAHQDP